MLNLSAAQAAALAHVERYAAARRAEALAVQSHVLRMCDVPAADWQAALGAVRQHASVALHFHPDRPTQSGRSVAEELLEDGVYRSQYETRLSNGGLTAHEGGLRDVCEQRLFGGAYHAAGVAAAERPKYGALDLLRHAEGPSPRFGSCRLVLASAVSQRCSFCYADSHEDPRERGTLAELDDVLAALLRDAFGRESALGARELTVPELLGRLRSLAHAAPASSLLQAPARNLNHYIEAQVHGELRLDRDVAALVADPSFRGSATGSTLAELCSRHGIRLAWHHGFELRPADVPRDFRGASMPSLAARVAQGGWVHARAIGTAVCELARDPSAWSDRGSFAEVLQELKLLWHVLVRHGAPRAGVSAPARG